MPITSIAKVLLAFCLCAPLIDCASSPTHHPESQDLRNATKGGLDASMVPLCRRVLSGDESVVADLAAHPLVKKMALGQRSQLGYTLDEFAQAAFDTKEDPRFSWGRLRKNASQIEPFVAALEAQSQTLIASSLSKATEFLPSQIDPASVRLNLVCGSRWDAFVLEFTQTEIFFDLGHYADAVPEVAMPEFTAILVHELWHLALLDHQKRLWGADYRKAGSAQSVFLYRMLNEGVGHYYSMLPKLTPQPKWPDFSERERRVFAMLGKRYPQYLAQSDEGTRLRILWSSHAGVPFWDKWSAIPGALMIHHLEGRIGAEGIKALLAKEPFSVFIEYDKLCAENPDWPRLPADLVKAAKTELDSLF